MNFTYMSFRYWCLPPPVPRLGLKTPRLLKAR